MHYDGVAYAGSVRAALLNGSATPAVRDIVYPTPFLTKDEQKDLQAKGVALTYEQTVPRQEGLINLSARVTPAGGVEFIAERERYNEPGGQLHGRQIVFWDGKAMTELYVFNPIETHNNFQNPPYLWSRPDGKLSLIRVPEKGATSGVREYPIEDGALGEPRTIAEAPPAGTVINWQPHLLPSGALAITASISTTKFADDADVYLTVSSGATWTPPLKLSDNLSKVTSGSTDTTAVNRVGTVSHFSPMFSSVASDADCKMAMVTVSNESTIIGFTDIDVSRRLVINTGGHIDSPAVYFLRLSPK